MNLTMENWRKFLLKEKTRLDKEIEKGKTSFKTAKGEVPAEEAEGQDQNLEKLLKYLEKYAKPAGQEDHMLHFNIRHERPAFHGRYYKTNTPGLYGWGLSEESLKYYRESGAPIFAGKLPYIFLIEFESDEGKVLDLIAGNKEASKKEIAEKAQILKKMVTKHAGIGIRKAQEEQVKVITSIITVWADLEKQIMLGDAIKDLSETEQNKIERAASNFTKQNPTEDSHWKSAVGKVFDPNTDFFNNKDKDNLSSRVRNTFLPNLFKNALKQPEVLNYYKGYMGQYFNSDDFVSRFQYEIEKDPYGNNYKEKVRNIIQNGSLKNDMERLIKEIDFFIQKGYGGLADLYKVVRDAEEKLRRYSPDFHVGFYLTKMGFNVRRREYKAFQASETGAKHPDEFTVLSKAGFKVIDIFKNPFFTGNRDKEEKSTQEYVGKGPSTKDREGVENFLSRVIKQLNTNQIKRFYREKIKEYDKPYTEHRMLMRKYLLANKQTPDDIKKEIVLDYGLKDLENGYDYIGELLNSYGSVKQNLERNGISPSLLIYYGYMLLKDPNNKEDFISDSALISKEVLQYMSKEQRSFRNLLNGLAVHYKGNKDIMNSIQDYAKGVGFDGGIVFEGKKFKINILSSKKGKKK